MGEARRHTHTHARHAAQEEDNAQHASGICVNSLSVVTSPRGVNACEAQTVPHGRVVGKRPPWLLRELALQRAVVLDQRLAHRHVALAS
jgi:hypothetical protein